MRGRHRRAEGGAGYGDVLRLPAFRALFAAHALSITGDQIARIAVALVVFDRTSSALLTAATYAASYAPWLLAGPLLSTLADVLPRRRLMVGCDLARAVLVGVMAVRGMPIWALVVLVVGVTTLTPPFQSARSALLPDLLGDRERYGRGLSLVASASSAGEVIGFAAGGALVAAIGGRGALLLDAATFLVSALLLRLVPPSRPPARASRRAQPVRDLVEGARLVFGGRLTREVSLLAWITVALSAGPIGLAVVYVRAHHGGAVQAGLLTAAVPAGTVVGALLQARLASHEQRRALMHPLAVLQCLPLLATAANPPVAVAALLWALSGAGAACLLTANEVFVTAVPAERRGVAFAVTGTGVYAAQGALLPLAGFAASALGPSAAVGVIGAGGLAATVALLAGHRQRARTGQSIPERSQVTRAA